MSQERRKHHVPQRRMVLEEIAIRKIALPDSPSHVQVLKLIIFQTPGQAAEKTNDDQRHPRCEQRDDGQVLASL